ncbi:hypothetical protein A8135_06495 [Legionella jamestowniensis]|uniref:F-box domain-containing protein n=2 Tax=Legionella jamestowniensis TaxID=455 RepID=A0ABX2XXH2_9GAMM|nr:hypothetical protein A8135_06495 [Legionella jamestowniensis]
MFPFSLFTNFFKKNNPLNHFDNSLPRECWLMILEYLQSDKEIQTLRLVSTEMQRLTTLTEAGKKYYQRNIFFDTYEKMKPLSQHGNNYAHFFASNLKVQVAAIKKQLATPSNEFGLIMYFDNSLQANEEKAYLAQQLSAWPGSSSSPLHSCSCYNHPTEYFHTKRNGVSYANSHRIIDHIFTHMDLDLDLSSPIYNHIMLIFTIDATESNRFIRSLEENKSKYQSKMPFIIVISLNPLIQVKDFHYSILKLFSILPSYQEKLADAFSLNDIHSDLWTNTSYKYNYYYRNKMVSIFREIDKLVETLINIKESLHANSNHQITNSR